MERLKEYSTVEILENLDNVPKGSIGTIVCIHEKTDSEPVYGFEFNDLTSDFELLNIPQSKLKVVRAPR